MKEERKSTQELFDEIKNRIIIHTEDNEIPCPTCNGLRFVYNKASEDKSYINNCPDCYNGKLYKCEYCGSLNKTDCCDCRESKEERDKIYYKEQREKELEKFNQAKKIKFNEYNGCFILESDEHVRCKDSIEEWIYDQMKYEKATYDDLPKYLWATQSEPVFGLNIKEIIQEKCEEGYEDMESYLNTEDEDLDKAQEYIDKWYKKQGNSMNIYYEDCSVAVLLGDLIKETREQIENEYKVNNIINNTSKSL